MCVCVRDWVTMLYSRNWHNIVNQLYSHKKKKESEIGKMSKDFFELSLMVGYICTTAP